jgi:hypothetical protein
MPVYRVTLPTYFSEVQLCNHREMITELPSARVIYNPAIDDNTLQIRGNEEMVILDL